MVDQIKAAVLPVGSVLAVGDQICKKVYDQTDGEHWITAMMWSGQPVYDRDMDRIAANEPTQVLRYGDKGQAVRGDARERLARHLYLTSVAADWRGNYKVLWDRRDDRINFDAAYAQADELLAVITGKDT